MIRAAWLAAALLAAPAAAQELDPENSDGDNGGFTLEPGLELDGAGLDGSFDPIEEVQQDKAATGSGARLRALDRISGALTELEISSGQTVPYSSLMVTLGECRYPEGNPNGDAFSYLEVRAAADGEVMFRGWMIASSPALNAMDHPRYDIWLLRCMTS